MLALAHNNRWAAPIQRDTHGGSNMTQTQINFDEYVGKRVTLTRLEGEGDSQKEVQLEATVDSFAGDILLIKPKGKSNFDMVTTSEIKDITLAPDSNALKPKRMDPIRLGNVRQHYADRHGASLTELNGITEEEAFAAHEALDHKAEDLGHYHAVKPAKPSDENKSE
jgi:hypothetical protein